jgi:Ssp1 endopeptidase immunity protein Rap1a
MTLWRAALLGLALSGAGLPNLAQAAVTEEHFQVKTAADLVALCSAEQSEQMMTAAANFCHGFAVGVYQTLQAQQAAMPTKLFCVPNPTPSRNEAIAAFVTWARASPAVMSQAAPDAILRYLTQKYPCAAGRL